MIFSVLSDLYFLVGLLLVIFLVIPYSILIFLTIWVYRDAKRKEINAAAWVLIVWIIPFFIGFILYLSIRNKSISSTVSREIPE
ncbi:MAG: PLDc N-terminal domain-containing protein [Promethearchaeota archaeon]